VVQYYFFSTILIYTINILLFGSIFSYIIYFFSYKNQYQNIIKNDSIYNLIKLLLLITLGISFLLFIIFLYKYFYYFLSINNYYIYSSYVIVPDIYVNLYFSLFEFSVDFFGIILLFLAYFVGILSLLALDNRIF
jgi:hypothetical protein